MKVLFSSRNFLFVLVVFILSCRTPGMKYISVEGKTMGSTYHITYSHPQGKNLKAEIDSLLVAFNHSVSTFIPSSTISKVNGEDTLIEVDEYFAVVFRKAQEVSEKTDGAFDVTVMPLVNGWGFGYTDTLRMDSTVVDSLRQLVDYRKVKLVEKEGKYFLHKKDRRIKVDFSAIAQGYGADLVSYSLEKNGAENYMVEITGEIRTKGKNEQGEGWRIGIDKPIDDPVASHRELKAILIIENKSMATSGNYRNFYIKDGKKYSHEINPGTGYPAMNNLLSVSVIAEDCMTADAYATAFMVMGFEQSLDFVNKDTAMDAYFIYADGAGMKTAWTPGVEKMMVEEEK